MNKKELKILDASIKLFLENGVKKATMDEIAAEANVSKVTIYKYFGDKDELYFHVGKSILEKYSLLLNEKSSENILIRAKVANVIEIISNFIASNRLTLCFDLAKFNSDLKNEYNKFNTLYETILLDLIALGKEDGMIKSNIENTYIFHYIDMGVSYFQNNVEYRNKMLNNDTFRNEYMDFLLSNIFTKAGD